MTGLNTPRMAPPAAIKCIYMASIYISSGVRELPDTDYRADLSRNRMSSVDRFEMSVKCPKYSSFVICFQYFRLRSEDFHSCEYVFQTAVSDYQVPVM